MNSSHVVPADPVIVFRGGEAVEVSGPAWAREVRAAPARIGERLEFMSMDHHAVRRFAVCELVRTGRPVAPEVIGSQTALGLDRVTDVLAELEETDWPHGMGEGGRVETLGDFPRSRHALSDG